MQLNQPIPPPLPGGENPYDFILNGNQKPKKSVLPTTQSKKQRILFVLGGAFILFSLFAIAMLLISSAGGGDKKMLTGIAQTQTEIMRVSREGATDAKDTAIQGFAQSTALVITSSQQKTTAFLGKMKETPNSKTLALGRSTKTDTALKTAKEAGRYDQELLKILSTSLEDYKKELSAGYKQATSKSQKQLLEQLYNQANNLTKNQPTSS
ncbi:MAG: hypothetical protein QG553_135 [Patescibacteria group bacterium]|nr:hypothetical protein [Patescibacteria group bacterium]